MEVIILINLKSLIFIFLNIFLASAHVFQSGLCSDPQCSEPIALGLTTLMYNSADKNKLSFGVNEEVVIYVKNYGYKNDLLGITLKDKKGFVPKNFVKETKTLKRLLVEAQVDFTESHATNFHDVSSHVHVSSHIPHDNVHHSVIQSSMPNNIDQHFSGHSHEHSNQLPLHSQDILHTSSDFIPHSNDFAPHSTNFVPPNSNQFIENNREFSPQSGQFISKNDEFMQPSSGFVQQSGDFIQHSNTLVRESSPLPNIQIFQQNQPSSLESSRQGQNEYSHFQASDISNQVENSKNFQQQAHQTNQHIPNINPSHTNFISDQETFSASVPMVEHIISYESQVQQPISSDWQNPTLDLQQSITVGVRDDVKPNFGQQSNTFYDKVSLPPHPHTQNQAFSSSNMLNNEENDFDQTRALLKSIGYDETEELMHQFPSDKYMDTSVLHQNLHMVQNSAGFPTISSSLSSSFSDKNEYTENPSQTYQSDHSSKVEKLKSKFSESSSTYSDTSQFHEPVTNSFANNENSIQNEIDAKLPAVKEEETDYSNDEELDDDDDDPVHSENELNVSDDLSSINEISSIKEQVSTSENMKSMSLNEEIQSSIENKLSTPDLNRQNMHVGASMALSQSPEVTKTDNIIASKLYFDNKDLSEENFNIESSNDIKHSVNKFEDIDLSTEKDINQEIVEKASDLNLQLTKNDTSSNLKDGIDDKGFSVGNAFTNKDHNRKDSDIKSSDNLQILESNFILSNHSETLDSILNISNKNETENPEAIIAYQTRHLKDIESINENSSPTEEMEPTTNSEFDLYVFFMNILDSIRSFVETVLYWVPEPLYTIIMDLEKKGISSKAVVFTELCAVPCVILLVSFVYIKVKSKEKSLIAHLAHLESNFRNLEGQKNILEDELAKAEIELQISRTSSEEHKVSSFKQKTEFESVMQQFEDTSFKLEENLDLIESLKKREKEYMEIIHDHEKEHLNLFDQKNDLENKLENQEQLISDLNEQLQEKDTEIEKILTEKNELAQSNGIYEEKLSQLQTNCNQLLQEAEVWNMRVNELNEKLNLELSAKSELENSLKEKESEIESLSKAVEIFKEFEEVGVDETKSNEEKLQYLINSSSILIKLQKEEDENKKLLDKLSEEKSKLLDMEVSMLDIKSENDKLTLNYNQALQDKVEAQTKLEVLTNYFKDKEIQLQKQLGVQEAVRQKTEEDASSAERRICLIEQENSSYKYQVATMKQEMEETERNLKSQIALQEKKAHENWLAARTAERKTEDMKQEITQLRQRLTLLEREQENWSNSNKDDIIRPVPKRIGNSNEDTMITQDSNISLELRPNIFPPPPMLLPPDRPLPPLPPLPPFLPPFEHPPPFRPQPWHFPPDAHSNSDYRMTPQDFNRGRESTPPRGRISGAADGDTGPMHSSPIRDMRDSRNSTPPHLLPDFHDIPPPPPRPFYPPLGPRPRYPMPPPNFRREPIQGQRRIDNQDDCNSSIVSQHSSVSQDNWHNQNSRV